MTMKTVIVKRTIEEKKEIRVSDVSGCEMPLFHCSAVTKIWCQTSDHNNNKSGNIGTVFDLDLMPEEMQEFKDRIQDVLTSMRAKYRPKGESK